MTNEQIATRIARLIGSTYNVPVIVRGTFIRVPSLQSTISVDGDGIITSNNSTLLQLLSF